MSMTPEKRAELLETLRFARRRAAEASLARDTHEFYYYRSLACLVQARLNDEAQEGENVHNAG